MHEGISFADFRNSRLTFLEAMPTIDRNKRPLQDFIRVLEVLLHKGPLPLNTIGPTVDLTPGSISIGVDRLVARGLVRRIESAEDRRVRIVALTPTRGKDLIVSAFRKHSGQKKRVFSGLSPEELRAQGAVKEVGDAPQVGFWEL